jgi:anti-sigma-K factor RskA
VSGQHDELSQLAPAYALGALDPDERRAFETHLSRCDACAAEVRSLARVTAGLAQTPIQLSPRPELRDRVLSAVGAAAATHRVRTMPAPRSAPAVATWLPAAAVLVLAAGFVLYAWDQREQMATLTARLDRAAAGVRASEDALAGAQRATAEAQAAIAVLTAPDLVRIDLAGQADAPQASARALWSRQRGMVFSGTNLPPLPAGRVYQVWVIADASEPISAGLLDAGGTGVFLTPSDIPPPKAVAVTIEPAPGVPAPTTNPFLVGSPAAL